MQRLLLICLISGWLALSPALALADAYSNGINAYKRGEYAASVKYLQQSVMQDPQNPKKIFYLGLAYSQVGQYPKAREAFEAVGKILPPEDPLAIKARNNMAVITQAHMTVNGNGAKAEKLVSAAKKKNNYLAYAIPNGKVIHWDTKRMPLKVYVSDGTGVEGWTPSMKSLVSEAMSAWSSATHNAVRFTTTNHPDRADIIVRWKRNFSHNKIGENPFESIGDTIVRSDLVIATFVSATGPQMPISELRKTIIHEMGHAIGIQGHSPYPEDIMYWSVNPEQGGALTARDKATISMLYKFEADVKNDTSMATSQSKKYFALFRQGIQSQMNNNPAQAMVFYQQAMRLNSKDPDLFFNLAAASWQTGNTSAAIAYYRRTLALDTRRVEAQYNLGLLLINEGVKNAKANQKQQARAQFQEAVTLLEAVQRSPKAPSDTAKMLANARHNLSITPG
jgi:tetratricopeptide (TPR) repeat protein